MVSNLEERGYLQTVEPDGIYDKVNKILETRPEIKRLDDRDKIVERLKGIM